MNKKALIITSVSGFMPQFEMENVKILQNMGYEVHYAANYNNSSCGEDNSRLDETGIVCHQVDFTDSDSSFGNIIKSYKQLVEIMKKERFALVHCYTPIGAALGRMAAHKTDTAPVVYTAHEFHFFKRAPLLKRLLHYLVERYFARYTDAIITTNDEDYIMAQKMKLRKGGRVYKVNGVELEMEEIYACYTPKVLLVTTVSGFVPQFEMGNVRILQEMGYEVHYATNYNMPAYGNDNSRLDGTGIVRHQVDFHRSPYRIRENVKAYRQLKKVLCEDRYSLVHCHTPMGAALARLAAHNTHTAPVVYTAHGFHFFTGAKALNWLVYYTAEKIFAHWTDVLITINQEDYDRASKHFHMRKRMWHKGCVKKINGVGIDLGKYRDVQVDRAAKRKELGLADDDYVFVSVGELIHRKNHQIVIRALAQMKTDKSVKYIICGQGDLQQDLEKLIQECGVEDKVKLLGYRTDVKEILKASDCFIFPSKQEGLPVALMEAMASGVPVLCSKIRGNVDLINHESQIIDITSPEKCARAMERKTELQYVPSDMSRFEEKNVRAEMRKIYGEILGNIEFLA